MTATSLALRDPGPEVVLRPKDYPPRVVHWGHCWQVGTPAYWVALTTAARQEDHPDLRLTRHRLGATLAEEIAACLLGGHGMPHQVGLAAFEAVRDAGLLSRPSDSAEIEAVLRTPLRADGRLLRYRFPAQRARYLSIALQRLMDERPPSAPRRLRDWLLNLPGVGPKTAAWIVRNHLDSDEVAIIDIHLLRAGVDAAIFDPDWRPPRDYHQLETMFLAWAAQGQVRPADLDAVIWSERARSPSAYRPAVS
jgi:N-glycosylase/DNA lyase